MSKKRDQRLDVLRGLLMTLVVLGHCIQYVADPTDFDHNLINTFPTSETISTMT